MDVFTLYVITRMDDIRSFACGGIIFSILPALIAPIVWACIERKNQQEVKIAQRVSVLIVAAWMVLIPSSLVQMFLPTTKQLAFILVAPKVIEAVQSNKTLTHIPGKLVTLADEWIEELRPEKPAAASK